MYRCVTWIFLIVLVENCFFQSQQLPCSHEGNINLSAAAQSKPKMQWHILQEPDFWASFAHEVLDKKSWKCSFPEDIFRKNLDEDAKYYKDDTIMRQRRKAAESWMRNDTLWGVAVLGACKELANNHTGIFVQELQKYNVLEALKDYVDHLHYFYTVARLMKARGSAVVVDGQKKSRIHDIDKLDPVMLVGYSERFEDNKTTSLWNVCVERHTHVNTHHQTHCLWHSCCNTPNPQVCLDKGNVALREMICDKVSRKLQKELGGKESEQMWDTDLGFYKGLPDNWLDKAVAMLHDLKHSNGSNSHLCSE